MKIGTATLLNMPETTNDLRVMFPHIPVRDDTRSVDAGEIVTSAGLDTSLHHVAWLESDELAMFG
jgi:transcriptional regulator GlxA family with amidase domain